MGTLPGLGIGGVGAGGGGGSSNFGIVRTRTELINGSFAIATANTWAAAGTTTIASTPAGMLEVTWDYGDNQGLAVFLISTETFFALGASTAGSAVDRDNAIVIIRRSGNTRALFFGRTATNGVLVAAEDAVSDPAPLTIHRISYDSDDLVERVDVASGSTAVALSNEWGNWEGRTVLLSTQGTGSAHVYRLTLDEPSGITHGDYFDIHNDHVDLTVLAATGITYTANDADLTDGNIVRFVFTDRIPSGQTTAVPTWTAYQITGGGGSSDVSDLNDLDDVDTGTDTARGGKGLRFNTAGTSLEAEDWPSGGGASTLNDLTDVATGSDTARGGKGVQFNAGGTSLEAADLVANLNDLGDVATGNNAGRASRGLVFNGDGTSLGVMTIPTYLNELTDVATGLDSARGGKGVRFNAAGSSLEAEDWPSSATRTRTEIFNGNITIAAGQVNNWIPVGSVTIASSPAGLLEIIWDMGTGDRAFIPLIISTEAFLALPASTAWTAYDRDNAFQIIGPTASNRAFIGRTATNGMLIAAEDHGADPRPLTVHRIAGDATTTTALNDLTDVATGGDAARGGKGLVFNSGGTSLGATDLVGDLNDLSDVATGANSARASMGVRFNSDGTSLEAHSWPASGQGSGTGNNEFQAQGEVVEYEDWTISGSAEILHKSGTNQRGIPVLNDATHVEVEIDVTDATTTSGNIAVEYSLDRGTTWHNVLDDAGDDVALTPGSTTVWSDRFGRTFFSDSDAAWNIAEDETLYLRVSGTGLGGSIDWEYLQEDDSKTTRSYVATIFDTDTTLPSRTPIANGSNYTVTQIDVEPIPWEKVIELVLVFAAASGDPSLPLRLSKAAMDYAGTYTDATIPTTFSSDPLKVSMMTVNIGGYSFAGPFVTPGVQWIYDSRAGSGGQARHRLLVGVSLDGAYLNKVLICAINREWTLKEISAVRER